MREVPGWFKRDRSIGKVGYYDFGLISVGRLHGVLEAVQKNQELMLVHVSGLYSLRTYRDTVSCHDVAFDICLTGRLFLDCRVYDPLGTP